MPRIAVVGAQNVGRTTFISDFIESFPNYKSSGNTYRDLIKTNKLKLNQKGNEKSQQVILDCLVDECMKYTKDDNIIHDRSVLDNLVYTLYLKAKNIGKISDNFVNKTMMLTQQTFKFIDLILYIPVLAKYPVFLEEKETRDTDIQYREEIDNIFKEIYKSYKEQQSFVFNFKDPAGVPPMIEIFGDREMRVDIVKMYLNDNGEFYKEDESALTPVLEGLDKDIIKKIESSKNK